MKMCTSITPTNCKENTSITNPAQRKLGNQSLRRLLLMVGIS